MAVVRKPVDLDALEKTPPEDMLRWAFEEYGKRAAIITSFQNTGCVMIDMASKVTPGFRVLTVDTLRLHDETYDLMRRIEERYGVKVERFQPEPERIEKMIHNHGEFLFFDSKAKQEYCCKVRKVEPNEKALATVDVWLTGVRRDQSEGRKETPRAFHVHQHGREILKLSPLADWTEEQVRAYIGEHNVPYNALYDMGYTSIGCIICTTPTRPGENIRAGRWRWFNYLENEDKECGIHSAGSGI